MNKEKRKNHITSHPVFPFKNSQPASVINKSVVNNPYYYKAVSLLDTIMLKLSRYYELNNYDARYWLSMLIKQKI